ncbi:putative peroxidase [Helianthus annuus]|nr:putative peroxidase [Helianthus annuus]
MPMNQLIEIFTSSGFTIQELLALSNAHIIGLIHCTKIRSDIYNYSQTSPIDPSLNLRRWWLYGSKEVRCFFVMN